jgi:hypothetical protein
VLKEMLDLSAFYIFCLVALQMPQYTFLTPYLLLPNIMVEWLTLLLCIQEVPGSILGPEVSYPACDFNRSQSLQVNARIVT